MAKQYKENCQDYRIMYEGSLARIKEPNRDGTEYSPIVRVMGFTNGSDSPDRPPTHCNLQLFYLREVDMGVETETRSKSVKMDEVEFSLPSLGYINSAKGAFFIDKKKPSGNGKYRKLPFPGDMLIKSPCPDVLEKLDANPVDNIINYDVLDYWNKNEHSQPQEALQALFNGQAIARAVSDKFCFFISTRSDNVFLSYNRFIAGQVEAPDGPVKLAKWANRFAEELESLGIQVEKGA